MEVLGWPCTRIDVYSGSQSSRRCSGGGGGGGGGARLFLCPPMQRPELLSLVLSIIYPFIYYLFYYLLTVSNYHLLIAVSLMQKTHT